MGSSFNLVTYGVGLIIARHWTGSSGELSFNGLRACVKLTPIRLATSQTSLSG